MLILLFSLPLGGCSLLNGTPLEGLGDRVDGLFINPAKLAAEHPEQRLEEFVAAMQGQDYAKAYTYLSTETKQSVPVEKVQYLPLGSGELVISKVEFTGKEKSKYLARVLYKLGNSEDQVAGLIREDGTWKIHNVGPAGDQ